MTTKINLNGEIREDGFISVFDHGFLFGDSIYEVITTCKGKTCFADLHLKRLHRSAEGMTLPSHPMLTV